MSLLTALALIACGATTRNSDDLDDVMAAGAKSGSAGGGGTTGGRESGVAGSDDGDAGELVLSVAGAPPDDGCDWRIPQHAPTLDSAIARTVRGGLLCIGPGIYAANVEVPHSISLRGSPGTVLCGNLELVGSGASLQGVSSQSLTDLRVFGSISVRRSPRFAMSHVDASGRARDGEQAPCGAGLESSVRVDVDATSFEQRIRVEDSVLPSSGLEVALASEGIIDLAVELERSRCISNQCWSFLNLGGPSSLPSGSRLKVLVQNNLVQSTVLEGLVLHVPLLDDADAALSEVRIINNTIHTLDDPNYGIVFRDGGSCPTIIANNAVGRFSQPLAGVPEGAVLACNQLADSFDPDASSWFVDAAGGDFTPAAPGSPLRDAGCKQWLPELDLFGAPRVTVDIGAIAAEK